MDPITDISPAPPTVKGHCLAGCGPTLVLAATGTVVCARPDCPDPDAAARLLEDTTAQHTVALRDDGTWTVRHPLIERSNGTLLDCGISGMIVTQGTPPAPAGIYVVIVDPDTMRLLWHTPEAWAALCDATALDLPAHVHTSDDGIVVAAVPAPTEIP